MVDDALPSPGEGGSGTSGETLSGTVLEALPNAMFRIALDKGSKIVAHVPARQRMHLVRLIPGDRVRVTLSPYDRSRGRIVGKQ